VGGTGERNYCKKPILEEPKSRSVSEARNQEVDQAGGGGIEISKKKEIRGRKYGAKPEKWQRGGDSPFGIRGAVV